MSKKKGKKRPDRDKMIHDAPNKAINADEEEETDDHRQSE